MCQIQHFVRLRSIEGIEFVEEAVAALGYSTELAHHLFRECASVALTCEARLPITTASSASPSKMVAAMSGSTMASPSPMPGQRRTESYL